MVKTLTQKPERKATHAKKPLHTKKPLHEKKPTHTKKETPKIVRGTPFTKRTDLTISEKDAIRHYRDLDSKQYKWNPKIKLTRKSKDCDVVNGVLRGKIDIGMLDKIERLHFHFIVNHLEKAISKSEINEKFVVYKGVEMFDGLNKYKKEKYVEDKAFSSFSVSKATAATYSGKNTKGEYIFFVLTLKPKDKVMYLDKEEGEWLVQKGSKYYVYDIAHLWNPKTKKNEIIYYLVLQ